MHQEIIKKMSRCLDPSQIPTGNSSFFYRNPKKITFIVVENYQQT